MMKYNFSHLNGVCNKNTKPELECLTGAYNMNIDENGRVPEI